MKNKSFYLKCILLFAVPFLNIYLKHNFIGFKDFVYYSTIDIYVLFIVYGFIALLFDNSKYVSEWKPETYSRRFNRKQWIRNLFFYTFLVQLETVIIVFFIILFNAFINGIYITFGTDIVLILLVFYLFLLDVKFIYIVSMTLTKNLYKALILPFLFILSCILFSHRFSVTSMYDISIISAFGVILIICILISKLRLSKSDIINRHIGK